MDPLVESPWLRCPVCRYDLRGLAENRCPECGTAFDAEYLKTRFFMGTKQRPLVGIVARFYSMLLAVFVGCLFLAFGVRQTFAMSRTRGKGIYYFTHHGDRLYNVLVQLVPTLIFFSAVVYLTIWLNRRLCLANIPNRGDVLVVVAFFTLPLIVFSYVCSGGIGFFS